MHYAGDKLLGAQQSGHILEGGGQGEDEDGGNHGAEAWGMQLMASLKEMTRRRTK